ncbi:hypothetical protein CMI46_01340 [Candidatus Pacearchaeota archaeon]|nr:hypothetical protein [Candidatus Pacearchaeota archaeon]
MQLEEIEQDYQEVKKSFQERDNSTVATEIAREMPEFPILEDVFGYLIDVFNGQVRRDNKTPLVFHSIYLTKLLYLCGEKNLDSHLVAALHDVIEDTDVGEEELIRQSFLEGREYLIKYLEILTEDKSLSRDPDGKTLPQRYVTHIKKMIGAPKEVVNLEIVDRFSDMMDLEYILELPDEKRKMRLRSKVLKVSSFVANIISDREDYNPNCLALFNAKLDKLRNEHEVDISPEIVTP